MEREPTGAPRAVKSGGCILMGREPIRPPRAVRAVRNGDVFEWGGSSPDLPGLPGLSGLL